MISPLTLNTVAHPHIGITGTDYPNGSPERLATGIGRASRKRSHTRRYQSRWGQLDDNRITIRRVRTTTSAATLISRVRQAPARPGLGSGWASGATRTMARRRRESKIGRISFPGVGGQVVSVRVPPGK